ncbi:MAG: DNA repair protein RecO [Candidatus Yanofskybacteria bacterium RIFCSPHIGHO2_02_FULL_38_22b]|uniref:DNA repair protein RecO n=1 Tax=Candidatus Yanofskybacteria bacterium RIFCSPHIGHO2_02_FULL_38_22b TaxID=1802673 RepID=A0A1F8EZF2_9BACT|nr:MAG: DNA repair protein RecO [Candidatus Yanofskybacteria bacterium RIFCSPHIGHO2_01_FULL_39_44]OGN06252.1 MAG: DNA repair protein RecO [Candidatus Yanofskybacteria bacterium RIFCSPHIGHO2_02_FULL_38_22b]OGN19672.1 MAG: DNA repair protein RecO [Candidatus Yanofskybacteria bacterium RIFCSPLOWO2_01_FULL_39_28]
MQTKAIIIKKQNTNEYDQLVTCYTEEFGKVTAIAKSVLKPSSIQAMHLDLFNLVEFELVSGRGMPIITGAQVEQTQTNLKTNLPNLAIAYFFVETIDKLAFEYQKDEELWEFLLTTLEELDNDGHHRCDGAHRYLKEKQLEFLNILGHAPNLKECAFCSGLDRAQLGLELIAYNIQTRGAVCKNCFLNGQEGIVVRNNDFLSESVLGSIFESLVEKKINSLNLLNSVLK